MWARPSPHPKPSVDPVAELISSRKVKTGLGPSISDPDNGGSLSDDDLDGNDDY